MAGKHCRPSRIDFQVDLVHNSDQIRSVSIVYGSGFFGYTTRLTVPRITPDMCPEVVAAGKHFRPSRIHFKVKTESAQCRLNLGLRIRIFRLYYPSHRAGTVRRLIVAMDHLITLSSKKKKKINKKKEGPTASVLYFQLSQGSRNHTRQLRN